MEDEDEEEVQWMRRLYKGTLQQKKAVWRLLAGGCVAKEVDSHIDIAISTVYKWDKELKILSPERLLSLYEDEEKGLPPVIVIERWKNYEFRKDQELKTMDKLLAAKRATSQVSEVVMQVTVRPDAGRYFDVDLPTNAVLIESITVEPSDTDADFDFIVFDREQQSEYISKLDKVLERSSKEERITYLPPRPHPYEDKDKSMRLHCGIAMHERHWRFDLNKQELEEYLQRPGTFTVTVRYALP